MNQVLDLLNLKTMKSNTSPLEISNTFYESPNGNYIVVLSDYNYHIIDEENNLKYTSEEILYPVNDDYFLEVKETNDEIYLISLTSGKKQKINITGKYKEHNASGLITKADNGKYYLYVFN